MKKIYALLLVSLLINFKTYPQYFIKNAGGVTIDEGLSIATTPAGVSFITGYYSGVANLGTGNFTSSGLTDGFVSKMDVTGNFVWTNSFGGTGIDKGVSIAVDNSENVYVAIAFESNLTIGSNTITSFGLRDILIAKYSSAGNLLWTQQAGGAGNDNVTSIDVDDNGNISVTGNFSGTSTFGSTTLNSTVNPVTSNPSVDIFISKLNTNGVFLWAKNGSAVYDDAGYDVVFDHAGAVYLYAQFSDTLTFDVTHNNDINNAVCIIKFDSSGNELWFKKLVGTSTQPTSITFDGSDHLIAVGNFTGTLNVFSTPFATLNATYNNRFYVLRFDNSGNLDWLAANSSDSYLSANSVVTGTDNKIYVIGEFDCRLNDFADVYGQGTFNSVGFSDVFVSIYDSIGSWQLARQSGGPKDDAASGAGIDAADLVYFTGSFEEYFNAPLSNGLGCFSINSTPSYCGDSSYNQYCNEFSSNQFISGNRDIITACCFNLSRQPYDYYIRTGTGCLRNVPPICINEVLTGFNCIDTLLLCPLTYALLNVSTNYTGSNSPHINFQWSNGSTNGIINAYSGTYTVTVTTEDGCFSRSASVYVGSQPAPLNPLISDSKLQNVNANPTVPVTICPGDSVILWATNISPGYSYYWDVNGVNVYEDTIVVSQNGTYYFYVGTPTQCPTGNFITIIVSPPVPSGIYKIRVDNDFNQDDTVASCGNNIQVSFIDSLTNTCYPLTTQWSISPFCNQVTGGFPCYNSTSSFIPDSTGLYTITVISIINDVCNHDTIGPVSKQVYFIKLEVLDPPILNITGVAELCPSGDTITLTCDTAPNYSWYGPSIISNDTLQFIQVDQPGIYTVSSTIYSVDGCPSQGVSSIVVSYKSNPLIAMTPASGIICPNDSISLVCYTLGTYQWIGPLGSVGVDSFIVYANQPGDYYCIVTDTDGCVLVSNIVVAQSYSSPTMLVTPSNVICNGSTATLQVIAGDGSALQWQAPLSGNNPVQVVDTAGTYTCAVLSCNLTTILSATITSPVFPSAIGVGGTSPLCFGDSIQLTAPAGYSYLWFPTGDTAQSIYVSLPGFYYVKMTDSIGCFDFTDSAFIYFVGHPVIPVLSSNSPICEGDDLHLTGTGSPGLTYHWSGPSGFSSTVLNPVISNVTQANAGVYAMYSANGACHSDTATMTVSILPHPATPTVTSNSPLCTTDTLVMNVSGTNLISYQWNGPSGFSSNLQSPAIANLTTANSGTYSVIGFDGTCYSDTAYVTVQILNPPSNPSVSSNSPVCEGDTLQFTSSSSAANFYWNGPAGFTSTLSNPAIANAQLNQAGIYYLIVANGGCFSDTVAYMVTVNPTPALPVIAGNTVYCENDSIYLATTSVAAAYSWLGPSGFSSAQQQVTIYPATIANSGLYQLVISDGNCVSDTASIMITVNSSVPAPSINPVSPLCEGDDLLLSTSSSGFTSYFWTGPSGFTSTSQSPVISNVTLSNAGNYSLVVSNGCPSAPALANVVINKNPVINNLISNAPLCEGDDLQLTFTATDFDSAYWTFGTVVLYGNPDLYIQNAQLADSGLYVVTILNMNCKNSDSLLVVVNECDLIIPNVFTPNDDGYNDSFVFSNTTVANINYKIFDRWGLVVYEGSGTQLIWNGKLNGTGNDVPEGAYYYFFQLTFTDKTQKEVKGYFELLR